MATEIKHIELWALKKMKYAPPKGKIRLYRMCSGRMLKTWKFVRTHVFPKERVHRVKSNLEIRQMHSRSITVEKNLRRERHALIEELVHLLYLPELQGNIKLQHNFEDLDIENRNLITRIETSEQYILMLHTFLNNTQILENKMLSNGTKVYKAGKVFKHFNQEKPNVSLPVPLDPLVFTESLTMQHMKCGMAVIKQNKKHSLSSERDLLESDLNATVYKLVNKAYQHHIIKYEVDESHETLVKKQIAEIESLAATIDLKRDSKENRARYERTGYFKSPSNRTGCLFTYSELRNNLILHITIANLQKVHVTQNAELILQIFELEKNSLKEVLKQYLNPDLIDEAAKFIDYSFRRARLKSNVQILTERFNNFNQKIEANPKLYNQCHKNVKNIREVASKVAKSFKEIKYIHHCNLAYLTKPCVKMFKPSKDVASIFYGSGLPVIQIRSCLHRIFYEYRKFRLLRLKLLHKIPMGDSCIPRITLSTSCTSVPFEICMLLVRYKKHQFALNTEALESIVALKHNHYQDSQRQEQCIDFKSKCGEGGLELLFQMLSITEDLTDVLEYNIDESIKINEDHHNVLFESLDNLMLEWFEQPVSKVLVNLNYNGYTFQEWKAQLKLELYKEGKVMKKMK